MKSIYRKLALSPAFIIFTVMFFSICLNLIYFSRLNFVHFYYFSGVFLFVVFYFIFSYENGRVSSFPSFYANKSLLKFYWVVSFLSVLASCYVFYENGLKANGNIFNALRYSNVIERKSSFSIGGLSLFPFALSLYYLTRREIKFAVICLVFSLLPSFVLVERTSLLMKLMSFCYVGLALRVVRLKHAFFIILLFLVLSYIVAMLTNRVSSSSTNDVNFIISYFSYGMTAFYNWFDQIPVLHCFQPLLGTPGAFIDYAFSMECVSSFSVPITEFNVLTYLLGGYLAFGLSGVFISMSLLGVVYGLVFKKSKQSIYFLYLSSVLIYPIVMIFYAWQFDLNVYFYLAVIFLPLSYRFRF